MANGEHVLRIGQEALLLSNMRTFLKSTESGAIWARASDDSIAISSAIIGNVHKREITGDVWADLPMYTRLLATNFFARRSWARVRVEPNSPAE
jgi:hypothetical protein